MTESRYSWDGKTRCLIAQTRDLAEFMIRELEMDSSIWAPRSYGDGGVGKRWDKIVLVWPQQSYLDGSAALEKSFLDWINTTLRTKTDTLKFI